MATQRACFARPLRACVSERSNGCAAKSGAQRRHAVGKSGAQRARSGRAKRAPNKMAASAVGNRLYNSDAMRSEVAEKVKSGPLRAIESGLFAAQPLCTLRPLRASVRHAVGTLVGRVKKAGRRKSKK
jgi:hypothetical protein